MCSQSSTTWPSGTATWNSQERLSRRWKEGRRKAGEAIRAAEAEIAQLWVDAEAREAALTTTRMARVAAEDSLRDEKEARARERERASAEA